MLIYILHYETKPQLTGYYSFQINVVDQKVLDFPVVEYSRNIAGNGVLTLYMYSTPANALSYFPLLITVD